MMKKASTLLRSYSELSQISDYLERFRYLSLAGQVGEQTFGSERYMNQRFYNSVEWKNVRNHVIVRDNGCDLGIEGFEIFGSIYIHHMNPMSPADLKHSSAGNLDPEFLISVSHRTHNAIHYGDAVLLNTAPVERRANDHVPWKRTL